MNLPPAASVTEYSAVTVDSPVSPSSSAWVVLPIDASYLAEGSFGIGSSYEYALTNPGASNQIPATVAFGYEAHSVSSNVPCEWNRVRQRTFYSYEIEAGYPRNTFASVSDINQSFSQVSHKVFIDGTLATSEIGSWYRVPANATVKIEKSATTPVFVAYNDTAVGNKGAFSSYSSQRYDSNISIKFDQSSDIDLQIDDGDNDTTDIRSRRFSIGSGEYSLELSRS
jgi:hypothetical protein